jgi:hypothetical protein
LNGTRKAFIEPSSPFIYAPPADFVLFARQIQLSYSDQGMRCTYDNVKPSLSSSCRFEKPCDQIHAVEEALFQMTLFDINGKEIVIRLEGKDMFIPGHLIDETDPTIANFCFIPILKQNFGPSDTWFIGAPILNDYYAVFDMNQAGYLQMGISVKNDELADIMNDPYVDDYNHSTDPEDPHFTSDKFVVIFGASVMVFLTILFICCRRKNSHKQTSLMNEENPG